MRDPLSKFIRMVAYPYGVFNISEDIIAHATNQNEHLQQLRKVFDKIQEKGLKLNLKRCEFGKASINYMGHILN